MKPLLHFLRKAFLKERLFHPGRPGAGPHHAHISGLMPHDHQKAFPVKPVAARHDHEVGIQIIGNGLGPERRCKVVRDRLIRPGLLCQPAEINPVIDCRHSPSEKSAQPDDTLPDITGSADYKVFRMPELFSEEHLRRKREDIHGIRRHFWICVPVLLFRCHSVPVKIRHI